MRYQRSNFCFFYFDNARVFDPRKVTADGAPVWQIRRGAFAVAVIAQKVVPLELDILNRLHSLARNTWYETATFDAQLTAPVVEQLARDGVLLCDAERSPFVELRRRHQILEDEQWHPYSALYYFMTQWRRTLPQDTPHDREVEEPRLLVQRHGPPPSALHRRCDRLSFHPLNLPQATSPLLEGLLRRRSSRFFDAEVPLNRQRLESLLYHVWGCQGRLSIDDDIDLLHKTSPSGGALHPIEVYPLICNVEGFEPGLYHYDVGNHGLAKLKPMEAAEARRLAVELTVGQPYFRDAQVVFVMTARFFRNFWKYHRIDKALSVVLMDAAFLGQTFYLVAAELGLGALFTAAVNALAAEQHLALDGVREGPVAVCACGARHPQADHVEPPFPGFDPGDDMQKPGMR